MISATMAIITIPAPIAIFLINVILSCLAISSCIASNWALASWFALGSNVIPITDISSPLSALSPIALAIDLLICS
ncbi:hypothetical protein D3C80_1994490 [compost metagenome]